MDHPTCSRCDSPTVNQRGCAECDIIDGGGHQLLDAIDTRARAKYGRGFYRITAAQQWALIDEHQAA